MLQLINEQYMQPYHAETIGLQAPYSSEQDQHELLL